MEFVEVSLPPSLKGTGDWREYDRRVDERYRTASQDRRFRIRLVIPDNGVRPFQQQALHTFPSRRPIECADEVVIRTAAGEDHYIKQR